MDTQPPSKLDDVLPTLEKYLAKARNENNPIGYFAALYKLTTQNIIAAIKAGEFEDNERMARMDVNFASRYFDALKAHFDGGTPSRAWQISFDGAAKWAPIVAQHLYLGMNAHINFDLAIAAAKTCPGDSIHDFKTDFDAINTILDSLVARVEQDLSKIWPPLRILLELGGSLPNVIASKMMEIERDLAWSNAVKIATIPDGERDEFLQDLDKQVADVGDDILHPGFLISRTLFFVRIGERGSVAQKIGMLS